MNIEKYEKAIEKIDEMLEIGKTVEDSFLRIDFNDLRQMRFNLNNKIKLDEVLEHNETIKLGKFVEFDFVWGHFYLYNKTVHYLLYDYIFGSHSGINEWFRDWFTKVVSPLLGCTNYSYALGSFDLEDIVYRFERFGKEWDSYNKKYEDIRYYNSEKVDKQLNTCKEYYNGLVKLSKNEEFISKLDSFLEDYFRKLLGDKYSDTEENEDEE